MEHGFNGATEAQSELVAHWWRAFDAAGGQCPNRTQIDPGSLRRHLADISLLEIGPGDAARFRLAGSRLRDLLGFDARGRIVADLPAPLADMWALGLEAACERLSPVGGIVSPRGGGIGHAWLRMPLLDSAGRPAFVLCHDARIGDKTGDDPVEHGEAFPRLLTVPRSGRSLAA